MHKQQECVES